MLSFGPPTTRTVHLCIDMQRVFAEDTPWHTPWMPRVLPMVRRIAEAHPSETVFTRFVPPQRPDSVTGSWRRYYERWQDLTLEHADPALFDLIGDLARLTPPASVVPKSVYSPWLDPSFRRQIDIRAPIALVITGAETDVCVLAAVLGAVDRGFRVVLPTDALCSSSDATHDALITLYHQRYAEQIETATTDEVLAAWC